jgi:polyisoprenoid-binding protein YceI
VQRISWILIALCLAASAPAQQATFELNPAKTSVEFTLGDTLHSVHGTFKAARGSVTFDPTSGEANGSFVVDATTGDTGNRIRDKKMNKEILESEKYAEISFTPSHMSGQIVAQGRSSIQVQGVFRLHGANHEMTLTIPVETNGGEATAKLHFAIPYVDWGLKDPSNFVLRVSKQVEIDITASGQYVAQTLH